MDFQSLDRDLHDALEKILGYLNFSSGAADPVFARRLSDLFRHLEEERGEAQPWIVLQRLLIAKLDELQKQGGPFGDVYQAAAVLDLLFRLVLPAYRDHHRDLLFHQSDAAVIRPFFLAKVCEAILSEGSPWDESDRIVQGTLDRLNDFVGHRPVAVLENDRKLDLYSHERIRPIPLYLRDAGVALGRYQALVERALDVLRGTDPDLLDAAYFDPELLDELAFDPRAYDFDHPVNRRPNYHFGQWDPHRIDNAGRYRRFVLQQVALDALLSRVEEAPEERREEFLIEAGSVLAGIILMAAGISGRGPETHDSTVRLANLLPRIAAYRDAFYDRLLSRFDGDHGERLRKEASHRQQPFAGARQHLNQYLARRRALQQQHVHLARLFAHMGYADSSLRQAQIVPVASARILCEIHCRLTASHNALDRGELENAAKRLKKIEDGLQRGIECGALVDPWNLIGFGGQFALFQSLEDAIRDHRIDELIDCVDRIMGLYSRIQSDASVAGNQELRDEADAGLARLVEWWDQFASTELDDFEGVSGQEARESANQVSAALAAWREAGAAAGDIGFWRSRVAEFRSAKAYAPVVKALLDEGDHVASMALLMHWVSQADQIRLVEGDASFHELARRWIREVIAALPDDDQASSSSGAREQRWPLAAKFFDYLEANASDFWEVPMFDLDEAQALEEIDLEDDDWEADWEDEDDEDGDDSELFRAAYEDVTYRDSTDDGIEGEMAEGPGSIDQYELEQESRRLRRRLAFLSTVARLWKLAAACPADEDDDVDFRDDTLRSWLNQAKSNRAGLEALLEVVHHFALPASDADPDSLIEYDRLFMIKYALLERVISTYGETTDAARTILASMTDPEEATADLPQWRRMAITMYRALLQGDSESIRERWPQFLELLQQEPLLYVPLARGGDPEEIIAAQALQQVLRWLLAGLPRLGMLRETCELIRTAREMERNHEIPQGAVTEFDRLFQIGYKAIVECVVVSSLDWRDQDDGEVSSELVECLQLVTESLLRLWLSHSRMVRLSALERLGDDEQFAMVKAFITEYGGELFTQEFLNLGNLRAILDHGVDAFLTQLEENGRADLRLVEDLDNRIERDTAHEFLQLVIEAVVENYAEYRDFNTTTTQSDRGELLYTLLDFLRLKTSYERIAWRLKPVVLTHEILVRRKCHAAAAHWARLVADQTSRYADKHLDRLRELEVKYGMQLPTVTHRLQERFVRPLSVDRVRALVKPAIDEMRDQAPLTTFPILEVELAEFVDAPSGVGLDVPAWLEALEREALEAGQDDAAGRSALDNVRQIEHRRLSPDAVRHQIQGEKTPDAEQAEEEDDDAAG